MAGKLTGKERARLEGVFLSCLLAHDVYTDWRGIGEWFPGVTWRHFADRRHRALWRAMLALDLKNAEERREIAEKELYENPGLSGAGGFYPGLDEPGDDLVRGRPGSAADRRFKEKLDYLSSAYSWLEREIGAAGALFMVGGKVYLRGLRRIYPVPQASALFARRLGFAEGGGEAKMPLCWNCARLTGVPPMTRCGLHDKHVDYAGGYGCEYWEKPRDLFDKLTADINGGEE